jgi:hypothetical protein
MNGSHADSADMELKRVGGKSAKGGNASGPVQRHCEGKRR